MVIISTMAIEVSIQAVSPELGVQFSVILTPSQACGAAAGSAAAGAPAAGAGAGAGACAWAALPAGAGCACARDEWNAGRHSASANISAPENASRVDRFFAFMQSLLFREACATALRRRIRRCGCGWRGRVR